MDKAESTFSREQMREIFRAQRENYTPIDPNAYWEKMQPKLQWEKTYFAQAEERGKIKDRC